MKEKILRKKKGFALILAVAAMAFMVLLTLTLSSVITSKLRLISAQKELKTSRANAVLGMSVALSELQRTLGKDNAVSFSASVFDENVETPQIDGVRTPYAIGALEINTNTSSYRPYDLQQEQMALSRKLRAGEEVQEVSWLISGQRRMKNPVREGAEDLGNENVLLATYKALDSYPSTYGGAVNPDIKNDTVEVKAGKVSFGENSSSSYAFWISDESLKAKINLLRPEKYLNENMGPAADCEAPADSIVPQISNTSFVEDVAELGLNPFLSDYNEANANNFAKINSLTELPLVDSNLSEWAKDNMGDWTASSVGIPVDVTQGRLKEDLSAYIYGGYGLEDSDPIIRGSGKRSDKNYSGVNFNLENYDRNLPTFGLLKSFSNLAVGAEAFDDGVAPRAHVIDQGKTQQHGIYPIINSIKWVMLPAYSAEGGTGIAEIKKGGTTVSLSLMMWPRIVIWNPHNVKLNASDYVIRIYMPYRLKVGQDPDYASAITRWKLYEDGEEKGDVTVKYKATESKRPHFGSLFTSDAETDNKMPTLNFQVKGLELRPGESVELNVFSKAGNMQTYADVPCYSMGDKNLLQPGTISVHDGPNDRAKALEKQCIRIDPEIKMEIVDVSGELPDGLNYNAYEKHWEVTGTDGVQKILKPHSHVIYEKNPGKYDEKPLPYLESGTSSDKWRLVEESYNGSSKRAGYEILLGDGTRLYKSDMTEWKDQNTIIANPDRGRSYDTTFNFGEGGMRDAFSGISPDKYSAVINPESLLFESNIGDDEIISKWKVVFLVSEDSVIDEKAFAQDHRQLAHSIRLPDFYITNNMIFTAANYRAPSLVSGDLDSGAVLKKAGDEKKKDDSSKVNFAMGYRFHYMSLNFDAFWGKRSGNEITLGTTGKYSWKVGEPISFPPSAYGDGGVPSVLNNELLDRYMRQSNDGYARRFGEPLVLSGFSGYPYDSMICAPFDYPRMENGVMSLGAFSRANLSPMLWQPTFAFGNSYVSPYMDRESTIESKHINDNELIDICYLLNSSMWDRFFLSSIPQKNASFEPVAGMRMPNTRIFIKSAPEEKSKLAGSDEAFENAAAYLGVDGAFNVNSTSYEAWRSVLGGLLGTKKKTSLGGLINENGQSASDSDSLKMPNPGDLHPLSVPETKEFITWVDSTVGRMISESEIDMLAREIVKEVKIRAPFFSLSDFVNRRLMTYSDSREDEDLSYQSLMGTIAAAIRKSELNEDRPKTFFNDKNIDLRISRINNDDGFSYVYNMNTLGIFAKNRRRDLGEQVKRNEDQYIEQAICTPYDKSKWAHNTIGLRGLLSQSDILTSIAPIITVRGDTFIIRAYGESKNPMTGVVSKAYCEAVAQRSAEPVDGGDDIVAPASHFGRRFNIISFRWLTPAEL